MAKDSYLTRSITFNVFNRKELPKNKRVDILKHYRSMDAFDQDRNFWNLLSQPVQSDRGYYSRKLPNTPIMWKHDNSEDESLALLGDLNKRSMQDVIDNVRELTTNISASNGFVDLRKIDWEDAYQQEEIKQVSNKKQKYKMIEDKSDKSNRKK